jgi:CPA1 family monovalent cation:H+ antiporter
VLVEGESLINDGVAVVVFATMLELIPEDATVGTVDQALSSVTTVSGVAGLLGEIAVVSLGGAVVGFAAGYAVYSVMVNLDEHMTEIVLTVVLAYGAFVLAEHYLHVSGVIATVVAGLFIGNRGAEQAMSPQTKLSIFNTWETGAFMVNTFIFVVIGVTTPLRDILQDTQSLMLLAPLIVLVLLGRAVAVYPLTAIANRFVAREVSLDYQHVMVWGGLHASIPIALVLGLPPNTPMRQELRILVFGIAAFSLVVQGLTVGSLIERLGIITTSEEEKLYQLLVGRARAVDEALEAADEMHEEGRIPNEVYERFETEYGKEKDELNAAISRLLSEHPEIRDREHIVGERQVLTRERSALRSAELDGMIGTDVADELLDEVNLKLEMVRDGESTVSQSPDEEGYEEFWRTRAREHGLIDDEGEGDADANDS